MESMTMPEDSETQEPLSEQFDFTDELSTDDDTDDGRLEYNFFNIGKKIININPLTTMVETSQRERIDFEDFS